MEPRAVADDRSSEAGFTLVEALIAILVLIVGLAAVSNLLIVAATNNTAASKATGTAVVASQMLEELKRRPYPPAVGGSLTANNAGFFQVDGNQAVGVVVTRWVVAPTLNPGVFLITVQSVDQAPITGGIRSRSTFTTFRAP
jgi:Tfp pilus assembly protein PilV